ncbi:MAG: cobalamin-binding protein [Chlorobi bacterium]|nr:cobalamin-binding protein [Chlorobiota bacterium]
MYKPSLPRRIICLTEETTETLYALGAGDLIVGISGFTVRPPQARKTKPKVSTYLEANVEKIRQLQPDVILAWSDLQAPIVEQLVREGFEVICFNHRTVDGILSMILRLGALIGKLNTAERYIEALQHQLEQHRQHGLQRRVRPRVYFEEWYDPIITGICWVSELIELCGGDDVFAEHRQYPDAKRRIVADPTEVVRRSPDIMLASWCGKGFKPDRVCQRPGWDSIPAVAHKHLYEIHSAIILQPGPAALTDGVAAISGIFDQWEQFQCGQQ